MTRSDYFRFRTGATGLSDEELLLLDRFFSGCWYPFKALYEEDFALHMNLSFSHGFSDEKVRALMERWREWGWLERDEDEDGRGPHYALTPLGGTQWEREYRPPWECYCDEALCFDRVGLHQKRHKAVVSITSPSRRIAEGYFRTGKRCRMFEGEVVGRSRTTRVLRNWSEYVRWKQFPRAIQIQAVVLSDEDTWRWTDWKLYQREQSWWRFPGELTELRLKGIR